MVLEYSQQLHCKKPILFCFGLKLKIPPVSVLAGFAGGDSSFSYNASKTCYLSGLPSLSIIFNASGSTIHKGVGGKSK